MIISHTHRFIYFGPPRTGSTSLTTLFVDRFDGEYSYRSDCDLAPGRFETLSGLAQHQIILPLEYVDYLTVLSVRNPYARFLSMFSFFRKRTGIETIEEYFPHAQPPISLELKHTPPGCAPIRIDRIIRVESLHADVNALPFVREPVELPHERKTQSELMPLTRQIVDFVNNVYRADFETFSYSYHEQAV